MYIFTGNHTKIDSTVELSDPSGATAASGEKYVTHWKRHNEWL